jgi:uncharacterized protein YyaL (SSP411 family)
MTTERVAWMPWGEAAFERAAREDKPILLSISAVWCHWCHVMDSTTYADPNVIEAIDAGYIPVRVDNDERPDVNARYNMGGWPTTAFLAPDGTTLTGATYLPPEPMLKALGEIARFYRERKGEIEEHARSARGAQPRYEPVTRGELRPAMVARIAETIADSYDEEYGGFGDAPKFPQPEALEFLLAEWRALGQQRYYEMVARTLRAMASGGTYDHVEGGFFRYSTTRDWSVPHFEKMAEDHAGLIRVLAQLQLWSPTGEVHAILRSATRYVRNVLRDPKTMLYAGSQDADESYYALPLEERRARSAPVVDRRSYSNWSAALAGALLWASLATDDDAMASESIATLDALHERARDDDGLLYHVVAPGGSTRVRGLLTDQVAYVRALLDAHEIAGEARFLDRARAHAASCIGRFMVSGGGFSDRVLEGTPLGRLSVQDRPLAENGIMADNLLRLATMTADNTFRTAAEATLLLYAGSRASVGSFAATYGRALRRYLCPELLVRIEGNPASSAPLREAARRLPSPFTVVVAQPAPNGPTAYLCRGTVCAPAIHDATDLRGAYETLATVR